MFIAATTGIRLYSHHCFTTDVEHASLIKSLATCDEHANDEGNTENCETKSCCNSEGESEPLPLDNNCCHDDSRYLKVTDDFIFTSSSYEKDQNTKLLFDVKPLIDLRIQSVQADIKDVVINPFHPPPPKSGKTLIVFLQHQKADPNPIA